MGKRFLQLRRPELPGNPGDGSESQGGPVGQYRCPRCQAEFSTADQLHGHIKHTSPARAPRADIRRLPLGGSSERSRGERLRRIPVSALRRGVLHPRGAGSARSRPAPHGLTGVAMEPGRHRHPVPRLTLVRSTSLRRTGRPRTGLRGRVRSTGTAIREAGVRARSGSTGSWDDRRSGSSSRSS